MDGLARLAAQAAARHEGMAMPTWSAPVRPAEPAAWEYQRVSNPDRFAVLHGRARAWAQVLAELPGVQTERLLGSGLSQEDWKFDAGARLHPPDEGPSLLLLEAGAVKRSLGNRAGGDRHHPRTHPWLRVAAEAADATLTTVDLPACGCDACDVGSEQLCRQVDQAVRAVVERWRLGIPPTA